MIVRNQSPPSQAAFTGPSRARLVDTYLPARRVAAGRAGASGSIARRSSDGPLPLSFAQERLWYQHQLAPHSPIGNVGQALRLRGKINVTRLEAALNELVRRHEILRTQFVMSDAGPVQVVARARRLSLAPAAGGDSGAFATEEQLARGLQEEARRPFDLARDLPIRARLFRSSDTDHTLLLLLHRLVADGWSFAILFRELAALYSAQCTGRRADLPELPLQFGDYAVWERQQAEGAAHERMLSYWKQQLAGALPVVRLPLDFSPPRGERGNGAVQTVQLPRTLGHALRGIGQREGATLFMTLLAAFKILLHRWTGQQEIVVEASVSGRRSVELEKLVGPLVNTAVFRSCLDGDPGFRELLGRVREMCVGALANQGVPLQRIVETLGPHRDAAGRPVFSVMFVLQNAPVAPADMPDLATEAFEVHAGTAPCDLTLMLSHSVRGLRASIEYDTSRFERGTIFRLLRAFHTLIEGIVAEPDTRISQLPLLTPAERHQLVVGCNPAVGAAAARSIPELFREQVAACPAALALTSGEAQLTYGQLEARANQLARRLQHSEVQPESIVVVCLERSVNAIVALLAVLKAGGAYVAVDVESAEERVRFILADARPRVVLTSANLRSRIQSLAADPGVDVLCMDDEEPAMAKENEAPIELCVPPEALACVSYEPGSTGGAQGVCVPHRAVARLVKDADYARFASDEVFLQRSPLAEAASCFEIWGALLNGGRLVVAEPGMTRAKDLAALIEQSGVTTLWAPAGLFHEFAETHLCRLQKVRQLIVAGDRLLPATVAQAVEQLPRTSILHAYGPAENLGMACGHTPGVEAAPARWVTRGRPIAGTQLYVLDATLQPVPMGVPGELYLGGAVLARGYLNRPDLTAERFVADPFAANPAVRLFRTGDRARRLPDGRVEILGRTDRVVNLNGFTVDLAEIESVLLQHRDVKTCAVIVRDAPPGPKCLIAYVVLRGAPATTHDWRAYLEDRLPRTCVPSGFVLLDVLPLTAEGTLDDAALPAAAVSRAEAVRRYVEPHDEVEKGIAAIWETLLGVHPIGVNDRFFDLGGHSLLAARMVAGLERRFRRTVPLSAVFEYRTVADLAGLVRTPEPEPVTSSLVEIQGQGGRTPIHFVPAAGEAMFWGYANLARHLGVEQPVLAFRSRGGASPECTDLEEMAAAYLGDLRARQPHGPYLLGGYGLGGVVAFEMARQLQAHGTPVALLALLDCAAPNTGYAQPNRRSFRWHLSFAANIAWWTQSFALGWSVRERLEFLRCRRRNRWQPGGDHAGRTVGDEVETESVAALSRHHCTLLRQYQPGPYAGSITLLRRRGHPRVCSFEDHLGWRPLARGGLAIRALPAGPGCLLEEPYVRAVAAALREAIGAAHMKGQKT
jgi:amino acid adenylation domain-containing protein